ncbi:hypothetical protein HT574_13335 [Parageobacillus sp. VR-IP]|uniref:hypothetical protein n=1 Tax=Parageobacillus sp. VR-IP TaxID=2742205 RepID=UPI001582B75E|nr:hypothetical protein [Parageobacillus sp. VR-IP]NUK31032.1 hypothetical protein [Parageobacillus sp. VR-IP]
MSRSYLLSKIREASSDEGIFELEFKTRNNYETQDIIQTAKWLESEMYIRLKEYKAQKADDGELVFLSGKILEL